MTRQLLKPLPDFVTRPQTEAADPTASVWVAANAGSGKTHVLTQRVLRLLLSDVKPEAILCLTYTKAAAAEMRRRVADRLAQWSLMDDGALTTALRTLGAPSDPATRNRARALFASALETPGGLKIQTIHAFCESVLHRFPLEAGVPIGFTVLEDEERARMVLRAREGVLAEGLNGDPRVADAVATLFAILSDFSISEAIDTALADSRKLRAILLDRARARANLRTLCCDDGRTVRELQADITGARLVGAGDISAVLALLPPRYHSNRFQDQLDRLDRNDPASAAWLGAFLNKDGTVPANFPVKSLRIRDPGLADRLLAEAERLASLLLDIRRAELIARSEALLDVLGAIFDRYEREKRSRSLLDFDDLVAKIAALFEDERYGPWVQYKLDAGIVHVLVDESQDTNHEQWRVVRAIANEFFVGDSAVERPRTVFAVGDEKQSIYSFQGADPKLFADTGSEFARRAGEVGKELRRVPLRASLRTLRGILDAVDQTFARTEIRQAVLAPEDSPVQHDTARAEQGGTVTLWPPIKTDDDEPPELMEWPLTVTETTAVGARQLASRIVGEIHGWIHHRRPLGPRGRPVTPDDILILVQTRNALFHEIIRELGRKAIPTPGADRLAVATHIGVLDLVALGDVLINPADDLQLAALLRSPLFDVDEDTLLALAGARAQYQPLWSALDGSRDPRVRDAREKLHRWRGRLDFERPFEFFAQILYAEGGLKRFHTRFGGEIDDVFAEFLQLALDHEQTTQPSLQGFLHALRASAVTVKRELAESGGGVRVMTVHGAKGLEAPIVILADACAAPLPQQLSKPVLLVDHEQHGALLVHASSKDDHVAQTLALRSATEANVRAEYWRKLYVGMTRAEDELYLTGTIGKRPAPGLTWYQAVEAALREGCEIVTSADGAEQALIYPRDRPAAKLLSKPSKPAQLSFADLLLPPLPEHADRIVVRPSSAYEPADIDKSFFTSLETVYDAEASRREGLALHAALQHLGKVERADWDAVLAKAMPVLLPDAPERHAALAAKATSILTRPELKKLFGTDSRAEVPFLVRARRNDTPIRLAGRMDRLVVSATNVTVVDYKSDAQPASRPQDVRHGYLTQLGLYALVARHLFPGRKVRAGILWTGPEMLMLLPPAMLSSAVASFTVG